jgi:tetratricopeptide (TPR) repeat protein
MKAHSFVPLGKRPGVESVRARWRATFSGLILMTAGCAQTGERAEMSEPARIEMPSRLPPVNAEHAARVKAFAANPSSTALRGQLAVFLHANDCLAEAAVHYEELRLKDPHEARWCYYLARIVQDEGQNERAQTLLGEAAGRAPNYALIALRRADVLLKTGESRAAAAAYHEYLTRVPGSPHARLGLARIAMQEQEWKQAESLLLAAVQHEPSFAPASALLVSVSEALGENTGAGPQKLEASVAHRVYEPDDPWLDELVDHCFDVEKLSVLADVAIDSGKISRGIELLERSRKIQPDRARTWFELAKVRVKTNDRGAATSLLGEAIRLDPSLADAHYTLVGELQKDGDRTRALSASDLAVQQNASSAGLHRQRGALLQAAGRLGEAEKALQHAVSLDPMDVKNVEALGNFYWADARKDLAIAQFERARALSPVAVKARAILGGYYVETGHFREAERCITEALEIEPGLEGLDELQALFHVRQGNLRLRAGDTTAAEAAYRLALDAKRDHEESVTNLVAVMLRTGRAGEAQSLLSTFIAQHPRATFAYSLAARVAAQRGDRTTAIELVTRGLQVAGEEKNREQEQALRILQQKLRTP